jgi:phosphoadenosine phosphosulfate reductase
VNVNSSIALSPGLSPQELADLNRSFEAAPVEALLHWALARYHPEIFLACSFGAEDVALVDMLCGLHGRPRAFYLDTGFLFPETYEVRDRILERYSLELIRLTSRLTPEEQEREHGPALWRSDPDRCCRLRKVEPLAEILRGRKAWITGIRREQALTRAHAQLIEWDAKFALVKVNPLAFWTAEDVWKYIRAHQVPYNALHDRNYPSIGCTYCTRPVVPGEDPRAGRWPGLEKIECGLHK